ncbi:replication protein RepB [Lactiplantibacillus plantarum]|nr:replication protein RepB [Lactiplantibacillus plantarum]
MPKTIRELADELKVSKQTIQYHYQRLPTKNRQKDSQGTNMISPTAERIIRDKIAKPLLSNKQQRGSKDPAKASKENNELIVTLRREVEDLKSQRDKQLDTQAQQLSSKDRQIDNLTKLIDQQQQLQLAIVTENRQLKGHVQLLRGLIENSKLNKSHLANDTPNKQNKDNEKENTFKIKSNKSWWHFW